jgi:hypothetical protein
MIIQPVIQDIDIYKDRDYSRTYFLKDSVGTAINITDWDFYSQIRPVYGSDTLVAEFTITTVPASGIVYLNMSHDVTITIDIPTPISISSIVTSSNMVWDLVTNDNTSSRYSLIEGKCTIHETVTRDVIP